MVLKYNFLPHTSPTLSRVGSEGSLEPSTIEASLPGSPTVLSPETPSPVKKSPVVDEEPDKYTFFRNMTDKRDKKDPTPPATRKVRTVF